MEVFTSGFLLAELEVKLSGKFRIGKKEVSQIIQSIESAFKKIEPRTSLPKVCRDNDDNKVLQLCETVKSNFLITGDNDLLVLIGFKETRIISPALFIKSFISVS
ncbi:MAG: putative toxin-antitoxin system toxin component, PIN family, partial [Chitinophagales bacterium]